MRSIEIKSTGTLDTTWGDGDKLHRRCGRWAGTGRVEPNPGPKGTPGIPERR